MSEAAFIAGDWGTSRLRLYLCDARGSVLARGEGEGASAPDCAGRFAAAVAPWDKAHGVLPAVLGGMVGSTIGWKEVPYLHCPAKPQAIAGAALRFDGQISTFDFRSAASPCYACVFPPDEAFQEVACSTMGVFSPTVGIIGAMQAAEALRVIGGFGGTLEGRLMMLDSLRMEWNTMRIARQADCPVCGSR